MSGLLDLTEKDFEMLQEALTSYEGEPGLTESVAGVTKMLLDRALGGKPITDSAAMEMRAKADGKIKVRKQMTIMLRAKLEHARQQLQAAQIAKP